jgi:signal transduction histidine kinase
MNPIKKTDRTQGGGQRQGETSPVFSEPSQFKKNDDRMNTWVMIGKITPEIIHDINNYLTGILGYAELLSMKKIEDEGIKNGLANISSSAEKCKTLLANLLSLAHQESSLDRFGDINEIIEKTLELRRCALRHRQIELSMDLGSKIPAVSLNGITLQKALLNLMFKAEEFLEKRPEGKKIILKSIFDSPNNTVAITISANGFGISRDPLAHHFELVPAEEPMEPENNFDLQEVKHWISEMEGSLIIESKKGEGPVFVVHLPIKGRD